MNVDIHFTGPVYVDAGSVAKLDRVLAKLDALHRQLTEIKTQGAQMALDLTELEAAVAENTSVDTSALALIEGFAAQLDDLAAQLADQPEVQAKITQRAADIRASSAALAAAVAANTTGGTPPPDEPPPA